MFMAHVVTARNKNLYERQLDHYFDWRYRIYTLNKQWMPENEARREVDQFDHEGAVYLLGFRGDAFVAGARLMPSSGPTLLRDVFPELAAERGLPNRSDWADWTRMFTVPEARERGYGGVTGAMTCAVMEYCLNEGVEWVGGVQETYWLPRWEDFGWEVRVLGLPRTIDGTSVVAAFMRVDEESLQSARQVAGADRPLIRHHGPRRAFLPGTLHAPSRIRRPKVNHAH